MTKAVAGIPNLEKQYEKCSSEQKVPDNILIDTKSCLGNMRSSLDYLWCKISGAGSRAHFPITKSKSEFVNKTMSVNNIFLDIAEKWQSYNGDKWLSNFSYIRNKGEHLTLIPQIRKETRRVFVCSVAGSVSWNNEVAFSSGASVMSVSIDTSTQMPTINNITGTRVEIWVDFLFDGSSISSDFPQNISVLPFLRQSLSNTQKIISELEKIQNGKK